MKNALTIWKWSLRVIARSPLALLALAAVVGIGLFGAFRWLYFPMESAVYLLILGLLWAIVQYFVLVSLVTATATVASDAAGAGADHLEVRKLARFGRSAWSRSAAFLAIAALLVFGIHLLFSLINGYSLEVASFLTFRSEKPVAPETIESIFGWIENLLWVVVLGFLLSFLLALIRQGWREALRAAPRLMAGACWRAPFLTGLISLFVFGGLARLLVTWRPIVPPEFPDYAQLVLRNGLALLFAVAGWLFWILSIARQGLASSDASDHTPESKPGPSLSDF